MSSSESIPAEAKNALTRRLDHPVAGTFTVFALLWNWRVLVTLIWGNASAIGRIKEIEALFPSYWDHVFALSIPALLTLLYCMVVPRLRRWNDVWARSELAKAEVHELRIMQDLEQVRDATMTYKQIMAILLEYIKDSHGQLKTMRAGLEKAKVFVDPSFLSQVRKSEERSASIVELWDGRFGQVQVKQKVLTYYYDKQHAAYHRLLSGSVKEDASIDSRELKELTDRD